MLWRNSGIIEEFFDINPIENLGVHIHHRDMKTVEVPVKGRPAKADFRIRNLIDRSHELARTHKRDLYVDNPEFLVYHWSGEAAAFSPNTGELSAAEDTRINIGDHNARVDIGGAYPFVAGMPSKQNGFSYDPGNWAEDYAYFLDHSPAEVHVHERIVGEFHWMLEEARFFQYPESQRKLGRLARDLCELGVKPNFKIVNERCRMILSE